MKNLLLTGSNGFIGKYFLNKYSQKYKIQTFSFLHDSFDTLKLQKCDTIIHLSALVHQMGGASKEEYERVNVTQTLFLANRAKAEGVKHFIFMSSVKVYGEESSYVYKETTVCEPQDEYGKSKLKAEKKLLELEDENFKVSIVRTPIVYGYGVKANIKNLITLVNKISILPFGNIENKRSMVYIGNLCNLIDKVIETKMSGTFLAADDTPLSTSRLIKLIAKEGDKKLWLISIPFFPFFLKLFKSSFYMRLYESLEIDNTQTKEKLHFSNGYSVEEGIHYMLNGEKI